MKRPCYMEAIEWIAYNDGPGDADATDVGRLSGTISVALVADMFGIDQDSVARAVVRYRLKNPDTTGAA